MPDMFCYMSVCKSRVANVSVQATRDVYFREHGGWIVMWLVLANQHLPIQLNGKIDGIKGVIEKDRDGAAESLIHEHCLRSVPNCDRLKRVNSSKALGAVGAPKTGKNK